MKGDYVRLEVAVADARRWVEAAKTAVGKPHGRVVEASGLSVGLQYGGSLDERQKPWAKAALEHIKGLALAHGRRERDVMMTDAADALERIQREMVATALGASVEIGERAIQIRRQLAEIHAEERADG